MIAAAVPFTRNHRIRIDLRNNLKVTNYRCRV